MAYQPYPEYKDSGVEWLGEVPAGWEVVRLKHIAKLENSNVDKHSNDDENEVKLCNYSDVYNNMFISSDIKFMHATATNKEILKYKLLDGDILITKDSESYNDIAIPALVTENIEGLLCGYHLAIIRNKYTDMNSRYMFYSILSNTFNYQFQVEATGITRFGLSKYAMDNSQLVIPPLPEQTAIAAFLDRETARIDQLIEKKRRLIELLEEKRTALISHVVTKGLDPDAPLKDSGVEWLGEVPAGWEVVRLKHIAMLENSNVDKHSKDNEYNVLLCNYTDVYNNKKISNSIAFMKATATDKEIYKYKLNCGDIMITKDSESNNDIAIPALVVEHIDDLLCGYHLAIIRNKLERIHSKYLFYALLSTTFNYQFQVKATGITRFGLSKYAMDNSLFIIPHLPEQTAIAAFLDRETARIDQLIDKVREGIDKLTEYRTALISAAVTGKIDVRDVSS